MATNSKNVQKKADAKRAGRSRTWATVVYPESAPEGWETILADTHVTAFVSPLHDKDVNPDGSQKKAHWHVFAMFDSVKTQRWVTEFFHEIGGVGAAERISTTRGYARYLCHLDNPEKYQYDTADVKTFGGADYLAVISLPTDRYGMIADMIDFCDENDIYSYGELIRYARAEREDWFRCLCDGAFIIKDYLKSRYWEATAPSPDEVLKARSRGK